MNQIESLPVSDLIPYARNSRTHSDEQVTQIAASIREFGFTNPVLIDSNGTIIAGHGRVMAAKKVGLAEVPCLRLQHLSPSQIRAYVIADNKLALNAGWDDEMLKAELLTLQEEGFNTDLTGFSDDELNALLNSEIIEGQTDPDEIPEPPVEPVTKLGDIWVLGNHRIMCGDSTVVTHVERLMAGQKASLMHADPPYGMGKASDGVINDNLYNEDLDNFQMEWWATLRSFLFDNASAYIWGNAPELWRLWYKTGLGNSEKLELRNQIVWDKKAIPGMGSAGLNQYPIASEHCLFFQLGNQLVGNMNTADYWEGWEPMRSYLEQEMKSIGWKLSDLNKATNTSMGSHWVTKSQWLFPTEGLYRKIQSAAKGKAFNQEYEKLKQEYEKLKQEYEKLKQETRSYFDNAHEPMRDVWEFSRVNGVERHGHATPKPVAMMERIMKSSLPIGGLCVEPFGGTGSTLMGAEKTGRVCYSMELNPVYCDVIVKRWEAFTGKKAVLEKV